MAALLLLVGAGCTDTQTGTYTSPPSSATTTAGSGAQTAISNKQVAFRASMQRLWDDHLAWTRMYLVSVADGLKDKEVVTARLMKNQEDLGNAIKPYYGADAGNRLTALLKEHITGATKVLEAAKAKDQARLDAELAAWRKNGDDIAALLNGANPNAWPLSDMKAAMRKHLDLLQSQATHHLQGEYAQSVKDYDTESDHVSMMADLLASGVIRQFPDKF